MQHLAQDQGQRWQAMSAAQQFAYLQIQLKQIGMQKADIETASQLIVNAVSQMLADERGQWILSPHQEARSEFPISAHIDGNVENVIIDRTFVDHQGVRWIIDYKTATLTSHDLNAFLDHEQDKYLKKMTAYCQAMQLLDNRPIQLGLYFPALPAWRQWTPDMT
jgi:hypothetical protein